MNWALQRLVSEWVKHERLIIAVDYDDTLVAWALEGPELVARIDRTRALLKNCVALGARVIVHTASAPERYAEIEVNCRALGLVVEGINVNLPGLKYGNSGKPYANIYLDDRAGLDQALDLLSAAYEIMRREKGANTYLTQDNNQHMRQQLTTLNSVDEQQNPTGGHVIGTGISIVWQNGPLGRDGDRKEPNGAFVEGVIEAAYQRLQFYQTASNGRFACAENARAMEHLEAALNELQARTVRREAAGIEGTHTGN